jgi:hypothetical protein
MVGLEIGAHAPRSTHSPFECADVFVPAGWIPFHDGLRRAQERKFGESPIQPDEEKCMIARRIMGDPSSHSACTSEELVEYRLVIEEGEARFKRSQVVAREVRQSCFAGSIRSSILSDSGDLLKVPGANWGGVDFSRMVRNGEASVLSGSRIVTGRVLLEIEGLDGAFPTANNDPIASPESLPYLSAFILYMIRASRDLGLSDDKRVLKKEVVLWLRNNWHPELGECSDYLVESMATLLRRPEDKKGGNDKAPQAKGSTR